MVPTFKFGAPRYPLSVVVLSHNRLDELTRNMPELIRDCRQLGYELVVVDNASAERVRLYLKAALARNPNAILEQNPINLGVAGGRNRAYAVAQGEFILSIDDDTRVSHKLLRDLPGLMQEKYSRVGILAFRVVHAETMELQNGFGDEERLVGNHHGAACAIRRTVLSRVGGIDDYCSFGFEELDLCIRVHAAGFEIRYCPQLVVLHNNVVRHGGEFLDRVRKRVFNNSRTMHKYFPVGMASEFANRYLGRISQKWIVEKDGVGVASLVWASFRGRYCGLRHRTPVPAATRTYYADPKLVPEFGNAPFFRPLIQKYVLRSKRTDSAACGQGRRARN